MTNFREWIKTTLHIDQVEFLGDGVYVGVQYGSPVMFTSDGESVTNIIVFETTDILRNFIRWTAQHAPNMHSQIKAAVV